MGSTNVEITVGSKLIMNLLSEVNKKRFEGARELPPVASGALPSIPAEPEGQDYKMQVSGGKSGATWTSSKLPGGSASLSATENGWFYYSADNDAWSLVNVQEIPSVDVSDVIDVNSDDAISSKAVVAHLNGVFDTKKNILSDFTVISNYNINPTNHRLVAVGGGLWDCYYTNVEASKTYEITVGGHTTVDRATLYSVLPTTTDASGFIDVEVGNPSVDGTVTTSVFTPSQNGIIVICNRKSTLATPSIYEIITDDVPNPETKYLQLKNLENSSISGYNINDFKLGKDVNLKIVDSNLYGEKRIINSSGNIITTTGDFILYELDLRGYDNFPIRLIAKGNYVNNDGNIPFVSKNIGGVFSVLDTQTTTGAVNGNYRIYESDITESGIYYINSRFGTNIPKVDFYIGGSVNVQDFKHTAEQIAENAYTVSKWKTELMSHSSILFNNKGMYYMPYNYSETTSIEDNLTSEVRMSIINILDKNNPNFIEPISRGETIGDVMFSSDGRTPEPSVFFNSDGNTFKLIFHVNDNRVAPSSQLYYQTFNMTNNTLNKTLNKCQLKVGSSTTDFNGSQVSNALNTAHGTTNIVLGNTMYQTILYFKKHTDNYYYCAMSFCESITNPSGKNTNLLLRTLDGITYESLGIKTSGITNQTYPETSIEIVGNIIYCMTRGGNNSYYFYKYDISNNTWLSDVVSINTGSSDLGRPMLFKYKGDLIALGNLSSNNYSNIIRSGCAFWKINTSNFTINKIKDFTIRDGCHYTSVIEDSKGVYWMTYSTDLRRISPTNQNRTNISMVLLSDIIGY